MNPLSLFTGPLWKLGTIGAGLVAFVLAGFLVHAGIENRSLMKERAVLTQRIDDPKTGYVAQLAQAHTNEATLTFQLQKQTQAYKQLSDDSEAKLASVTEQLHTAQAQTAAMQVKLKHFLATGPQGTTLEERINDIDHRAMSELVK